MLDIDAPVLVHKDVPGPVLPPRLAGGIAVAVLVALRAELLSGTTRLCECQSNGCFRDHVTRVAA
jgi:hypothetical protein